MDTDLDYTCPRCGNAATGRFYGPCPSCRSELLAAYEGAGRVVDTERFEPKLHVVPNHVATKE